MDTKYWKTYIVCLFVLGTVLVTGCATIMNGDMVLLPVGTLPPQAKLIINGQQYLSPAMVLVPRGKGNFTLHVEKEGYQSVDIPLKESIDGWVWGNILFGGIVGLVIDFASGRAYDIDPEEVNAPLQALGASYDKAISLKIVLIDISQLDSFIGKSEFSKKQFDAERTLNQH